MALSLPLPLLGKGEGYERDSFFWLDLPYAAFPPFFFAGPLSPFSFSGPSKPGRRVGSPSHVRGRGFPGNDSAAPRLNIAPQPFSLSFVGILPPLFFLSWKRPPVISCFPGQGRRISLSSFVAALKPRGPPPLAEGDFFNAKKKVVPLPFPPPLSASTQAKGFSSFVKIPDFFPFLLFHKNSLRDVFFNYERILSFFFF